MVEVTVSCFEPDVCGRNFHIRTIDVNPGDTGTIGEILVRAVERGASILSARIPHVGKIGGITQDGMIWVINPN